MWNGACTHCNFGIQILNLLHNLLIVDYALGPTGSIHDLAAWKRTRIHQHPEQFLRAEEWVWADSAYSPSTWCVPPFKKPPGGQLTRLQRHFNYHLSRLRVRSEHTIGLLKRRFQSLNEIRIRINNESDHKWVMVWMLTCMILHNFIILFEGEGAGDEFPQQAPADDVDAEELPGDSEVDQEEIEEFIQSVHEIILPPEYEAETREGYIFRLRVVFALFNETHLA